MLITGIEVSEKNYTLDEMPQGELVFSAHVVFKREDNWYKVPVTIAFDRIEAKKLNYSQMLNEFMRICKRTAQNWVVSKDAKERDFLMIKEEEIDINEYSSS